MLKINTIKIKETFYRFPLSFVSAGLFWIVAMTMIWDIFGADVTRSYEEFFGKLSLALVLIFFTTTATKLIQESKAFSKQFLGTTYAIELALIIIYIYRLEISNISAGIVYGTFLTGLIIFNFISPYVFKKNSTDNKLWTFAYTAGIELGLTIAISGLLFVLTMIMIGAIDALFGINVEEEIPETLFVTIGSLIAPALFLTRVPTNFDDEIETPKLIKYINKFVLLPFVLIYLGIILVYGLKVVATGKWPEGTLVYTLLVLILPALAYIVVGFLERLKDSKMWNLFNTKTIYMLILIIMPVYFSAIWIRISEYGYTLSRYTVLAFGLWAITVCLYYLLSKNKKLIFIPLSLLIFLTNGIAGPLSAFNVTERSQINRLSVLLGNKDENAQEIYSVLDYMYDIDNLEAVDALLTKEQLELLAKKNGEYEETNKTIGVQGLKLYANDYMKVLDIKNDKRVGSGRASHYFGTRNDENKLYDIEGYKSYIPFVLYGHDDIELITADSRVITPRFDTDTGNLEIEIRKISPNVIDKQRIDLINLAKESTPYTEDAIKEYITEGGAKIVIEWMNVSYIENAPESIGGVSGYILLK